RPCLGRVRRCHDLSAAEQDRAPGERQELHVRTDWGATARPVLRTTRTPGAPLARKAAAAALAAGSLLLAPVDSVWSQSHALPSGDVRALYTRLLPQIERIRIFDHHAHPGFGDDPDVDAQTTPPQHLPFRARED